MFYCCLFHCVSFYYFPTRIGLSLLFVLFPNSFSRPVYCFFSCRLWLWYLSSPGLQTVLPTDFNSVIPVFLCAPLLTYVFTSVPQIPHQFSQKHWKSGHFSLCTGSAKWRDVVMSFTDTLTSRRPVESQAWSTPCCGPQLSQALTYTLILHACLILHSLND